MRGIGANLNLAKFLRLPRNDFGWRRLPETPADRAIREKSERLRKAFPAIDFDSPGSRSSRSDSAWRH
jgi:hypothetical protein